MRMPPRKVAETLIANMQLDGSWFSSCEVAGPGFMNFNAGFALFFGGFMNLKYMGITPFDSVPLFILYVVMTYVGISMLCNVFPLVEDAMNLYGLLYTQKKGNIIGRILAFIPTVITYAGAYAEKYCVTLVFWIVYIVLAFVF